MSQRVEVDVDIDNRLEDMIHDIGVESFEWLYVFNELDNDVDKSFYPGCTKYTGLSEVLRLVNLKGKNGWTDTSITELLELFKDMLSNGNTPRNRNYKAKKILCQIGMKYKKIHTCPNDCILYMREFEGLGVSHYKQKNDASSSDVSTKRSP
ncbi:hypothetical protein L6164_002159 [Bauhinia variegata]|uniref:Uncharacterized protein n=1 Tax=Bauhinia variegata TaxID=167791 RepID=A0ACB9PXG9_BAUVA|nr:hypothetical protein L6164_002159 [Bauhinia variegata]